MRNDLTDNFLAKLAENGNAPIQLMVFHFLSIGDIFVSDREVTVNGQEYKPLVVEWGQLNTIGNALDENSQTMELVVTLWNGGNIPFSLYFDTEDPVDVFVDVYQTFEGLADEDMALIGNFVMQDPITFNEASHLLTIDLVTVNIKYYGQVGELLTKEKYPNALESDMNKPINLIIGDAGEVETLCSNTPARSTMSGSILKVPTKIMVHENLNDSLFSASGYLQIDSELMYYSSKGVNYFNVTVRGSYATTISEHSDGVGIIQGKQSIDYVVGQGPLTSITDVLVKGQTPSISYQVFTTSNPAFIRFESQPTYVEYSRGARTTELDFDTHTTSGSYSNALYPENAYLKDKRTLAAIIGNSNQYLSIKQVDPPEDDGEIVKVFLAVEHWATKHYKNSIAKVYADGIGYLGYLGRPNKDYEIDLTGVTDIEHGHDHEQGSDHQHDNVYDPSVSSNSPSHLHPNVTSNMARYFKYRFNSSTGSRVDFPRASILSSSGGARGVTYDSKYYIDGGVDRTCRGGTVTVSFEISASTGSWVDFIEFRPVRGSNNNRTLSYPGTGSGSITLDTGSWYLGDGGGLYSYIRIRMGLYANNGQVTVKITNIVSELEYPGDVDQKAATVSSYASNTRVNRQTVDVGGSLIRKEKSDVLDLTEYTEKELEILFKDNSSLAVVEKFDLTKNLEKISWQDLQGKSISIIWTNLDASETAQVAIVYSYFIVEYRQKQVRTTDDITASVVGSIGNRPDEIIQYLLTEKAGVPLDLLGSVWRDVPLWDDAQTWFDRDQITGENNVWNDGGESVDAPTDAAFQEAAGWYLSHDYKFDGIIDGSVSVKEAVKNCNWQSRSRLFWQNGKCKLAIKRKTENWNIARALNTDDLQLRSIAAEKSKVGNISNNIDLFYDIDRLSDASGTGAFNKSTNETDLVSVEKHGERKDNSLFMFDLLRDEGSAKLAADYYIWALGETTTLYSFNTYLKNFFLEKSDYITLTSGGFQQLKGVALELREVARTFGSGRSHQMNFLNVAGESIRRKSFIAAFNSDVIPIDNLEIIFGSALFLEDAAIATDELFVIEGREFEDDVNLFDSLESVLQYGFNEKEVVVATDEISCKITVNVDDLINVNDLVAVNQELCFGACGFGAPNCVGPVFGSKTLHSDSSDEYLYMSDELSLNIGSSEEDITLIEDSLVFGDGFGCPTGNGSGFGESPFGDNC